MIKWASAAASLSLVAGLIAAAPAGAATIYQNTFEGGSTANITGGALTTAPNTQKYLGELANGNKADLKLTGLAANSTVDITFDLYTVNSLDGTGADFCCGPDPFKFSFNGTTLLDANFANESTWHQTYPAVNSPAGTGSDPVLTGALGYNFYGPDHTYHLSFSGLNLGAASTALFSFLGATNQPWSDEGYGIDNIVVTGTLAATPIPAALPLFISALGVLGWTARRRRKQQAAA